MRQFLQWRKNHFTLNRQTATDILLGFVGSVVLPDGAIFCRLSMLNRTCWVVKCMRIDIL